MAARETLGIVGSRLTLWSHLFLFLVRIRRAHPICKEKHHLVTEILYTLLLVNESGINLADVRSVRLSRYCAQEGRLGKTGSCPNLFNISFGKMNPVF